MAEHQGEEQLRAGAQRQPLIGALRGDREARLGVHEFSAYRRAALTEMPELTRVEYRRRPASQKVRADPDGVSRAGQVVNRQAVPSVDLLRGLPLERKVRQLETNRRWSADRLEKTRDGERPRTALRTGEEQNARRIRPAHLIEFLNGVSYRLLPRRGGELGLRTRSLAPLGSAKPVRMIERLHSRLPARAQPAAANRVERVAFNFLDHGNRLPERLSFTLDNALALHDPRDDAAAGRALRTDTWMPRLLAGHNFPVGNQQRNVALHLLTARRCHGAGRGGRENLEKVSAVHKILRSGRPRSPRWPCFSGGSSGRFPWCASRPARPPSFWPRRHGR